MKKTNHEKLLRKVSHLLDNLGIDYFITGGFAVSVWGRPRATFDIDMVIEMTNVDIKKLASRLRGLSKNSYVEEETMREAVETKGEFNFIDPATGVKVDFFVLGETSWDREKVQRKIKKDIYGVKTYFISPEDLILSKLKWCKLAESNRHLEDARSVLNVSRDKIDNDYLRSWAEKLGISKPLEKIKSTDK